MAPSVQRATKHEFPPTTSLDQRNMRRNSGLNIIAGLLLLTASMAVADERHVLRYDAPATDNLQVKQKGRSKGIGYIQTALPLGNGRLGAMFSGGIDTEHLLINDITLWMNAKRGMDPVAQSGTRTGGRKNLETVRAAYRNDKYGTKDGGMENRRQRCLEDNGWTDRFATQGLLLLSKQRAPGGPLWRLEAAPQRQKAISAV